MSADAYRHGPRTVSDWTESLEAEGPKDSGVLHRAFDGQRSYYRCDSKTGFSTSCGRRPARECPVEREENLELPTPK